MAETIHPGKVWPIVWTQLRNFSYSSQTDVVIAAGALKPLKKLLQSPKANIVKEAAWTISNITAGNAEQIEHVMNADVFPLIRTILEKGDFKSQKEASWIITNTTTSGTPEQVIRLVTEFNVFIPFCLLMDSKDPRTVNVVLGGLSNVLELAEKYGGTDNVCRVLEEHGCIDLLEKLQSHENEDVYKKSLFIIERYFNDEEVHFELFALDFDFFDFFFVFCFVNIAAREQFKSSRIEWHATIQSSQ